MEQEDIVLMREFAYETKSLYESYKMDFQASLDNFSHRHMLYSEGICDKSELFDSYTESVVDYIKEFAEKIIKFIKDIIDRVNALFVKNKLDKMEKELQKNRDTKSKIVEVNMDLESAIEYDKKNREDILSAAKNLDSRNITRVSDQMDRISERYEKNHTSKFIITGFMVSIASVLSALMYFKRTSSKDDTFNKGITNKMEILSKDNKVIAVIDQKDRVEAMRKTSEAVRKMAGFRIPIITNLLRSIKLFIKHRAETAIGLVRFGIKASGEVVNDSKERRKAGRVQSKAKKEYLNKRVEEEVERLRSSGNR